VVEKPWGTAKTLLRTDSIEIVEVRIVPGGFSSIHDHERKYNLFIVHEGEMQVFRFRGDRSDQRETAVLTPESHGLIVPPLVRHQFEAFTEIQGIEVYWPVAGEVIDPRDIRRYSENGVKQQNGAA